MHRWFRFCAVIALMAFSQGAQAQSPSPTASENTATGEEVPVSKHRLKPSPTQVLQFNLEQQGKRIDQIASQLEAQTRQMEAQNKLVDELTKRAELQSKQIETLNTDLNRLTSVLLARSGIESAATPHPTVHASPAPLQPEASTPVKAAEPAVPAEPEVTTAPDGTPAHVIKRGENLISIARQHGTSVSELLKINKIEDERKLQIGQTLLLPKPTPQKN